MAKKFYTAFVKYTVRTGPGAADVEVKTAYQDVTDDMAEGACEIELADRVYHKQVANLPNLIEVIDCRVVEEKKA